MLGGGGLAVSCVTADGAAHARLTLQVDGSTFLRCTAANSSLADAVGGTMIVLSSRIATACGTLAAVSAVADTAVLAVTLTMAAGSAALSGTKLAAILLPTAVFAAYVALTPLRGPLLRLTLRLALRSAVSSTETSPDVVRKL